MDEILIIPITLLFSAFFSGMEIAFITSDKLRIEVDRKQGHFSSFILSYFTGQQSKFLTTMLLGNNVALVIYGLIMASLLEQPISENITQNPALLLTLQTLISTLIILVTAEFIPKTIFRNIPNTALNILAVPLLFFYIVFYPVTLVVTFFSNLIIKGVKGTDESTRNSEQIFNKLDLLYFINQVKDNEMAEAENKSELKLFQNALEFSTVKVRDCLVPRTEIEMVELETPIDELSLRFIETGHSKILVYKESTDNIIGYITSKSLFTKPENIQSRIIEASYVPETMPASKLLERFIQEKKSMAVVVDEFGGVSGMLTIEDIIEEIFGEIEDEHDISELIEKQINENEFILSGRLEIDYLNEKYNLNIPESEDYETLAGYIFHYYESIPTLNEHITIDPYEIKILKASNTKIELVHFRTKTE